MVNITREAYFALKRLRYPIKGKNDMSITVNLKDLVANLSGSPVSIVAPEDTVIHGITSDSRKVRKGFIFVAVPGTKDDGHRFAADAVKRGCAAVVSEKPMEIKVPNIVVFDSRRALAELCDRFYDHPSAKMKVIGITGTNGKSTTAFLVRSILEVAGEQVGLMGTIVYQVGKVTIPSPMTTPGADELQRYLWEMSQQGAGSAVLEVSSHSLVQQRVHGIHFAGAIFTNLTQDHLDYHKTLDEYREAKSRLFSMLSSKSLAVVNIDDPSADFMASRCGGRVIKYGFRVLADVTATVREMNFKGSRFILRLGREEILIQSRLIGHHNVSNIMAAAALCWGMGFDIDVIKRGVEKLDQVPGRLEPVSAGQDFSVFVDYAHTDDALRNVLGCLKPLAKGRILTVFGCGGDRDRGKRPKMGKVAEEFSDVVVLTSDNPRSEDPRRIIQEIQKGLTGSKKCMVEPDRARAIEWALGEARSGDVLLIAGKGHETTQITRDESKPFDDRVVARQILSTLHKTPMIGLP